MASVSSTKIATTRELLMPAWTDTVGCVKVVTATPGNAARSLPAIAGSVLVFDRGAGREHRLVGYIRPDGDGLKTYALYHPRTLTRAGSQLDSALRDLPDADALQVAAGCPVPRLGRD